MTDSTSFNSSLIGLYDTSINLTNSLGSIEAPNYSYDFEKDTWISFHDGPHDPLTIDIYQEVINKEYGEFMGEFKFMINLQVNEDQRLTLIKYLRQVADMLEHNI